VAIEANTNIGYSKLRVAFDSDKVTKIGANSLLNIHSAHNGSGPNILSQIYTREAAYTNSINGSQSHSQPLNATLGDQPVPITPQQQQVIGDITEPFWVQATTDGAVWGDPDDLCLSEAKRLVTASDKRIFWEMARAIMVNSIAFQTM
jgi:hypothetical protein